MKIDGIIHVLSIDKSPFVTFDKKSFHVWENFQTPQTGLNNTIFMSILVIV